jgi:ribose transport system substrate-binding protein
MITKTGLGVAAALSASLLVACAAPSAGPIAAAPQAQVADQDTWDPAAWDTTKVCGTKPIKIGVEDGLSNTWRKTALQVLKVQAAKCSNIDPEILYASANGNPQQVATDVNSMVAKGVNVLIVLDDFGDSELPALRAATKAGVTVVPYYGSIGGTPGTDYAVNVKLNEYQVGVQMADWFGKNVKTGNVAVVGDVPTSTSSKDLYDGVKAGLAKYPALTLVGDSFLVGNYDPQTVNKVVTAAIQKYGDIRAIATQGFTSMYIQPFAEAKVALPSVAAVSGANMSYCQYAQLPAGQVYPLATWEKTTQVIAAALRHGLASYNKIDWAEPTAIAVPNVYDTVAGRTDVKCDSVLPPDADLTSGLTSAQLAEALK